MTRAVTLADLIASRAATTSKPATASDAHYDEGQSDCAPSFSLVLEKAGSPDAKNENWRDQNDDEPRLSTDAVSDAGASRARATTSAPEPSIPEPASSEVAAEHVPLDGDEPPARDERSELVPKAPCREQTPTRSPTHPTQRVLPHVLANGAASQSPAPATQDAPSSDVVRPAYGAPQSVPNDLLRPVTPHTVESGAPPTIGLGSAAGTQSLRSHAVPLETACTSPETLTVQPSRTAPVAAETAGSATARSPHDMAPVRTVASRPTQRFDPSSAPTVLHGAAGTKTRDFAEGTNAESQPTDACLSGPGTPSSPPVVSEPVTTPLVTTTSGEFAVHVSQMASPASAPQPPRSDFVTSNAVLTATISRPLGQGNGTYSVTAMLNPPSLGHVQAVVKVDGTNVNVAIVAHTADGHHLIAGHLEELRTELEAHGGEVQLSLSDGSGKGRQHSQAEPSPPVPEDNGDSETLLLSVTQAQPNSKSLHVIL